MKNGVASMEFTVRGRHTQIMTIQNDTFVFPKHFFESQDKIVYPTTLYTSVYKHEK